MTELPETRQSLLVQLRGADKEAAWTVFQSIYEPAIFRFAMSRGLQEADARDVCQQVLLAVHGRITNWDPDESKGSFRGWLFRVTRNLASKRLRQARRTSAVNPIHEHEHEVVSAGEVDASVFLLEYRRQVFRWAARSVSNQFTPKTWSAFWKTSIGTESTTLVARELGMSVGAVYAAKCRVMSKLREVVEQLTDDEPSFEAENEDE